MLFRSLALSIMLALTLTLDTCAPRPGLREQIDTLGTLRVATVNSATTYYLDAGGRAGFEYDLAEAFAQQLGLKLDVLVLPNREAVIDAVTSGQAHIGVGLAVSESRRERVRFTPPYRRTLLEAVYRVDQAKPADLAALSTHLALPRDTALVDWLRANHPEIEFETDPDANAEELMDRVASGTLGATIAGADVVAMNQRYYTSLRVAFRLPAVHQYKAWAFAKRQRYSHDDALYNEAIAFLEQAKNDDRMRILRDRYFGHLGQLGFVGGHEFARQVDKRLDDWRDHFKEAGAQYDLDWRLLAAIGYQESHWDKNAVSPTMVRGIMMLTRATASEVDVNDRRDPQQSIDGGARYFIRMLDRLPEQIDEPDRTWFALAAYNMGYGHVMDARRLLAARGRDPDLWVNLRDALPWLTQKRYLDETRYGYARGQEARTYVANIRAYYDILVWMTDDNATDKPATLEAREPADGASADPPKDIAIESPAF